MRRLLSFAIACTLLPLVAAASADPPSGSAQLTIKMEESTQTLSMNAHFATGVDSLRGEEQVFALYFYSDSQLSNSMKWAWISRPAADTDAPPETGTYSFATLPRGGALPDNGFIFGGEINESTESRPMMLVSSQGGSFTITASTEDRVEGTFEVENLFGGTITGEFSAPRGTFTVVRGPGG